MGGDGGDEHLDRTLPPLLVLLLYVQTAVAYTPLGYKTQVTWTRDRGVTPRSKSGSLAFTFLSRQSVHHCTSPNVQSLHRHTVTHAHAFFLHASWCNVKHAYSVSYMHARVKYFGPYSEALCWKRLLQLPYSTVQYKTIQFAQKKQTNRRYAASLLYISDESAKFTHVAIGLTGGIAMMGELKFWLFRVQYVSLLLTQHW